MISPMQVELAANGVKDDILPRSSPYVGFDSLRPIKVFFCYVGTGLPGLNESTKLGSMCLAQGHIAVTPVRLEPAASRSRVKHSTTEPLPSPYTSI